MENISKKKGIHVGVNVKTLNIIPTNCGRQPSMSEKYMACISKLMIHVDKF